MNMSVKFALLGVMIFASCVVRPNSEVKIATEQQAKYRLMRAYTEGEISLKPPLSQYAGLIVTVNQGFITRDDFLGIRIDINIPNDEPRSFGDGVAAVVYFFEEGKSIVEVFDENNVKVDTKNLGFQGLECVDYDISNIQSKLALHEGN